MEGGIDILGGCNCSCIGGDGGDDGGHGGSGVQKHIDSKSN